ncbi:MAG: penicillin-binding protein 2, partial [Rhodospirillaceae bacterium]|nr:penicillin-binding protein 2 [Rhodospirillaceae bacterium]
MRRAIYSPRHADPRPPRPAEMVVLDGTLKRRVELSHTRLFILGAVFAIAFAVVGLRVVDVTVMGEGREPPLADARGPHLQVSRADIVDRNGVLLATSLRTGSLYAHPQQILDPQEAASELAQTLPDLDRDEVLAKLTSGARFVWIKRSLTPREQYAVHRLGIPGLYFQKEDRRVYPQGSLAAHVVGFTDIDGKGLAGIEESFDQVLAGGTEPVQLSLDLRIQNIVREELARAIADFSAIGGAGIVLDSRTGEILALVSLPDFDPNDPGSAPGDARFNRATLGVYEMGSTFKIFNTALALDSGVATLASSYDARKPIRIGRYLISDFHPERRFLTVPEIFTYSSNIGAAKMSLDIGPDLQQHFMKKLGMLRPMDIELPEVGQPLYPSPWRIVNMMTIAYGHGIAVTPLHLVSGVAAVIDGGVMRTPTLLKRDPHATPPGERIVSETTSAEMRELMRLVVQSGTGKFANVPGYDVGGKTGTAEKLSGRHYVQNARMAAFVGAFPMTAPRYVILVMVDEPKPNKSSYGYATGGWVAAPAVGRIVE